MSLTEKLKWRAAIKKFDNTKKLTAEQLNNLLSAVQLAPSAFGLQPYKVIVVEDAATREKLREAAYDQAQLTEASHIIIFAAETTIDADFVNHYVENIAKTREVGIEHLEGYRQAMLGSVERFAEDQKITWAHKQAYIALGALVSAAADSDIDAAPMEGFAAGKFDEILGLKEKGLTATVIAAIGFRSTDDDYSKLVKVRRPKEELFIHI